MASNSEKLTNFLPVNRKLFEHRLWAEKRVYSKFEAWLDLLQSARFENTEGSVIIGIKVIKYGRGQFVASLRFLAERWGWGKHKVEIYLDFLGDEGMIKKGTAEGTQQTVITICKYDTYNSLSENRGQQRGSQGDSSGDKSNKVNKENKYNKKDKCTIPDSGESVYPELEFTDKKLPVTLHARMVHYWLKEFRDEGWTFKDGLDGAKIKSLIKQLKTRLTARNIEVTDDSVLDSFKTLCENLPEFYKSFDLKDIDSNFNRIITEIKDKRNGKPTSTSKQSTYDQARAVFGS